MKAIILSAGQGTRLRPITDEIPKPMVRVLNKPILEYIIDSIYDRVDELIIVVGYKPEAIKNYFGDNYKGVKITYHHQVEDKKGTGSAIMGINIPKDEDIFLIYGDAILDKIDLEKILNLKGYGSLVKEVENPEKYGIFKQDENGFATKIIEKPIEFVGNLANLGVYKFSSEIIDLVNKITLSSRGEYELTDAINMFLENNKFRLEKIEGKFIDVSYPEDIEKAEIDLMKNLEFGDSLFLESFSEYELHLGLTESNIKELISYSTDKNDIALQENTSDLKRFSTRENFNKWYIDTDRYVFSLLTKTGELAGLWWARPCDLPETKEVFDEEIFKLLNENKNNIFTSGIRIYPKFRGKGLAKLILRSAIFLRKIFPKACICVDIDKQNIASQKSYETAGYKFFGYGENKKTVESVEEPRMLYLEIPNRLVRK